jgi:hypothetical protein
MATLERWLYASTQARVAIRTSSRAVAVGYLTFTRSTTSTPNRSG